MAAIVGVTERQRVDVLGDDRLTYLQDVTSQQLTDVPITHVRGTLVLDGKGNPTAMFEVVVLGDRVVLLAPDDEVAATATDVLGMRTFLLDARFEHRDHLVAEVRGPDAAAVVGAAGLTVVPGRCRQAGDLLLVSVGGPDHLAGVDLVGPAEAVQAAIADLVAAGAEEVDAAALDDERIRRGVPAWGREVVAPHLPEEAGVLPTHVHLAKGCYPGQEAVARMWMLGRPRRRLAVVDVEGAIDAGWTAGSGRRTATVTSVAPDGDVALAFVPGTAEVGERIADESAAVVVRELVGEGRPVPGHDPTVTRRRDTR